MVLPRSRPTVSRGFRRVGVSSCRTRSECRSSAPRPNDQPSTAMIRVLSNVLTAAELQAVRELLPSVRFGDGRITNPASTVKQNLQASQEDPANQRIAQIAR